MLEMVRFAVLMQILMDFLMLTWLVLNHLVQRIIVQIFPTLVKKILMGTVLETVVIQ